MSSVAEAMGARNPLGSALAAGVENISYNQKITFDLYHRFILPTDGSAYWVKAALLSPSALLNAFVLNGIVPNQAQLTLPATEIGGLRLQIEAQGSLHYTSDSRQDEEANYVANRVQFTSLREVQNFNVIGPNFLYIARFDGIQFAFSARSHWYQQAELWHYVGDAVYSTMSTQVVDDPRALNVQQTVVSNSLPAWLAFAALEVDYPVEVRKPAIPFYPSYLVTDNLPPPYVSVHIDPGATQAIQSFPALDPRLNQAQLCSDRVTLTLYGCNNDAALNLLQSLLQYSFDEGKFGILNMPTVRDEKQIQNELSTLAMKKRIIFDVSYYQQMMRDTARQMILSCIPEFIIGDSPLPPGSDFIIST